MASPVFGDLGNIPPAEEENIRRRIGKISIDRCGGPSAVIGRTLFESVLIASAIIAVQIGGKLALMAPRRT
jgi:hypothetical protein